MGQLRRFINFTNIKSHVGSRIGSTPDFAVYKSMPLCKKKKELLSDSEVVRLCDRARTKLYEDGAKMSAQDRYFWKELRINLQYADYKANVNRDKNIRWKTIYIWFLAIATIVALISYLRTKEQLCAIAILLAGFLLASCVKKWLDIKKYQETWARHRHSSELQKLEMRRVIYGVAPYNTLLGAAHNRSIFKKRIIEIVESNIAQFSYNMNEKEIKMTDFSEKIKFTK